VSDQEAMDKAAAVVRAWGPDDVGDTRPGCSGFWMDEGELRDLMPQLSPDDAITADDVFTTFQRTITTVEHEDGSRTVRGVGWPVPPADPANYPKTALRLHYTPHEGRHWTEDPDAEQRLLYGTCQCGRPGTAESSRRFMRAYCEDCMPSKVDDSDEWFQLGSDQPGLDALTFAAIGAACVIGAAWSEAAIDVVGWACIGLFVVFFAAMAGLNARRWWRS
jgi:hypothetical protein